MLSWYLRVFQQVFMLSLDCQDCRSFWRVCLRLWKSARPKPGCTDLSIRMSKMQLFLVLKCMLHVCLFRKGRFFNHLISHEWENQSATCMTGIHRFLMAGLTGATDSTALSGPRGRVCPANRDYNGKTDWKAPAASFQEVKNCVGYFLHVLAPCCM